MISTGVNLVMTVIGFAVSTMFIVFVCTRLVCARILLNSSRRSFPISSRSGLSIPQRGLHGLEPVVVANLPTKLYNDEFFSASVDMQCSICLAEYHSEDALRILPYCGHSFHVSCIDLWLRQHTTCPVCRISLRGPSNKKWLMPPQNSSMVRYQYSSDTLNSQSYNYPLTRNGFSPETLGSHGNNRAQDDHCTSLTVTVESTCIPEASPTMKESPKKNVENPSNSQIQ